MNEMHAIVVNSARKVVNLGEKKWCIMQVHHNF